MTRTEISYRPTILALALFAVAMAALEAIVVVYLRQIYYPEGFHFPLTFISAEMVGVEWLREAATIIMLVTVGILAGKNAIQRFCYFLLAFGIWDIFYYVWLKVLLDWPESFLTWDILFLIPIAWVGPVLAPVICSITMIFFGSSLLYLQEKGKRVFIARKEWVLVIIGACLILATFLWDYTSMMCSGNFLAEFSTLLENEKFLELIYNYVPVLYRWSLFIVGEILIVLALVLTIRRAFQS